jgi:hypothetical protein
MWLAARGAERYRAKGLLRKAIDAYRQGFEADIRDTFPGINLATLLAVEGSEASLAESVRVAAVVRYAAAIRARKKPDYWDHATLLEAAALDGDVAAMERHLDDALAAVRETFEPETTARNLLLIAERDSGADALHSAIEISVAALEELAREWQRRGAGVATAGGVVQDTRPLPAGKV